MGTVADTRYTKTSDGVHIAYQVVGDGPFDLVFVPGLVNHLDFMWEDRLASRFFQRLASFSRLILFDKRGTGLSDRDVGNATLEDRIEDVRAVMAASGSERAALFGYSEGGPMSILFAATDPERTSALVLAHTFARVLATPDHPSGLDPSVGKEFLRMIEEEWGSGSGVEYFVPSLAHHEVARASVARWERMAGSPGTVSAMLRFILFGIDLRPVLPTLNVPTLVIQRTADRLVPASQGRYLAEHIPGARYYEQEGDAHILWLGDAEALLDEVQEFLTGARPPAKVDRVLATVLFTDIVDSTRRGAEVGDRRWRELIERHDELADRLVGQFSGRLVKCTGDGILAAFDGPARAIRCAAAFREAVRGLGLEVRSGLHTGEVEVRDHDIGGIAVNIAARVEALAGPGEVFVSRTIVDLVAGSGIDFADRGEHQLKGVPGAWRLFALQD